MLSFLKSIFLPREDQDLVGDVTSEDWAPLSSSVSNTPIHFAEWLQEDTPPSPATSWPRKIKQKKIKQKRSRPAGSMDFLSPEERHIVEQQQRAQRLEEAGIQQAQRLEEVEQQWV